MPRIASIAARLTAAGSVTFVLAACGDLFKEEPPVTLTMKLVSSSLEAEAKRYTAKVEVEGTHGAKFDAAIASSSNVRSCDDSRMERQHKNLVVPGSIALTATYASDPSFENRLVCVYPKRKDEYGREESISMKTGVFAPAVSPGMAPNRERTPPPAQAKPAMPAPQDQAPARPEVASAATPPERPASPRIDASFQFAAQSLRHVTFEVSAAQAQQPPHKPVFDGKWALSTKIPVCDTEPYGTVLRYLFPQTGAAWKGGPLYLCSRGGSPIDTVITGMATTTETPYGYTYGLVKISKGAQIVNLFVQRTLATLSTGVGTSKIVDGMAVSTEFESSQASRDMAGTFGVDLALAGIRIEATHNQPGLARIVVPGREPVNVELSKLH